MKKNIIGLTLILLTTIACNTSKKTQEPADNVVTNFSDKELITKEKWILTELEGQEITGNKDNHIYFTLNANENRIQGFSGCNTFMGEYNLNENNRIRFSKLASTRMACFDTPVAESEVLKVFELADNYTIKDNLLMLNIGRRSPLAVFKKSTPEIVGKYWKLKTLGGQEVKMSENQEREIHFILESNTNRIKGFAGCNTFNGTYALEEGNRINFSQMAATLKACSNLTINESEFLKVFELANNYTIKGDVLSLNIGRRAPLAVFEAVYFH
ncbi:META domain-containing protein [uncultured Salegentibacter sp.]|uniref:META domain-containing protein n=1 Tax=uncultured Salegentibacter sp. TaxID=259320 RepID=UPI002598293E|nr:META domain-containing protein [uncultured Salegentibacter sp.]